jgi:uncharacterized protein YcbK (DUF882 family)
LWITRPQAQESLREIYWVDGRLHLEGCAAIQHLYRDLWENRSLPIHPRLLHLNYALQCAVATYWSARPMVLFSGFRTPATNRRVGGVEPSVHGLGLADDYCYEGLSLADNLRLLRAVAVGGVGIYPAQGSLHKDVARPRAWVGKAHHASVPPATAPVINHHGDAPPRHRPCATCTN